jgi:hypothetical protein
MSERSESNVPSELVPATSKESRDAKILKNFILTQMAALVVLNSDCSKLSKAAIKKAIRTS